MPSGRDLRKPQADREWQLGSRLGFSISGMENDMHPYLFHRTYLSPSLPYARAYRKRSSTGEVLRGWMASAARWRERRKMIAALEAMDNRLLRDIGIYRNDIPRVVDGLGEHERRIRPLAAPVAKPVDFTDETFRKAA